MAKSGGADVFATDVSRRGKYRFGKQQIQFYLPSSGVPSAAEAKKKPSQNLELEHVYGFSGGSRQQLHAKNGKLVYFLAAAGIVYDVNTNSQRFFLGHNDDLTTICLDPREGSTLVASGQKDPKDIPGQGKDLPKIYIWDMDRPEEPICLIDRVCVNLVRRVRWSPVSGNLFVICGDDAQTLKVFNTSALPAGGAGRVDVKAVSTVLVNQPTTRQQILGICVNPKPPRDCVDEVFLFCKGKVLVGQILEDSSGKFKLGKLQAIQIKGTEKAYPCATYLPAGRLVFGGTSGNLYGAEAGKLDKTVKGVHSKALSAICINETGNTIYTSSPDGMVKCMDSRGKLKWEHGPVVVEDSDFQNIPTALCFDKPTNSLYLGTKSNQIARFDLASKTATVVIDGHDGQVWGLATHPKKPFFVTGGWDRAIKVWDPKTWTCKRTKEFPKPKKSAAAASGDDEKKDDGAGRKKKKGAAAALPPDSYKFTQTAVSPNGNWIAGGTDESSVVILNFTTLAVACKLRIPLANPRSELEGVNYLRWSPCGKYLGVAHGDGHLYIVSVSVKKDPDDAAKKIVKMSKWKGLKLRAAASHVQWGEDSTLIKVLTRDYEVAHFTLDMSGKSGKQTAKTVDPDKYSFAGDPLVAGWDVQGLYQEGFDGTDLNDCSQTSDKALIATGDDYGNVRLHKYPALNKDAFKIYPGHAEHVVGVEFMADDSYLLSCGGADMAIFQWKLCGGSS